MDIVLGPVLLDPAWTAVREQLDEVGGRDAREIVVQGVVTGLAAIDAIEARLDEIVNAASEEDYSSEFSARFGRVLFVRRKAFAREVCREERLGAFALVLEARDPYEWSAVETVVPWTIDADPKTLALTTAGTVHALLIVQLTPQADVTQPAIDDGERTLLYSGIVPAGQALVIDAERAQVTLDGEDVTPYVSGDFPRIAPGGTTLTFSDADAASPNVAGEVRFRDRWW